MPEIKIELSLSLVNAVLSYLGTCPYTDVVSLVNEIHAQGKDQVPALEESATDDVV
jgi:hypothetical protein